MCFNYAFLLTDFYKNDFIPGSFESNSVIVPVNKPLWEDKGHYFQKLYAASATFCFGFSNRDMDWEHADLSYIRDSLSLFFFLPNYMKKAGAYLLVSDLDTGKGKELMDDVERLLETQGIAPLSKNYTAHINRASESNKYYYYSKDFIEAFNNEESSIDFSALFKKMVTEDGANKQIVITVKDEADFKRKTNVIKEFEQWVLINERAYINLLSVFKKVNDEYLKLKIDNKKLRFRLDNYNDYLKLLRELAILHVNEYQRIHREQQLMVQQYNIAVPDTNISTSSSIIYASDKLLQKELEHLRENRDNILNWYTKEYEVLPLWYKRFGHIVKVLTGKRSLKSLYK